MNSPKKKSNRIRPSIKRDKIHPRDFLAYDFRSSCDDCTHFDRTNEVCTLGYNAALHREAEQLRTYCLSGNMALCRFHEID